MMEAINASGNWGGSLQTKRLERMHIEYIRDALHEKKIKRMKIEN